MSKFLLHWLSQCSQKIFGKIRAKKLTFNWSLRHTLYIHLLLIWSYFLPNLDIFVKIQIFCMTKNARNGKFYQISFFLPFLQFLRNFHSEWGLQHEMERKIPHNGLYCVLLRRFFPTTNIWIEAIIYFAAIIRSHYLVFNSFNRYQSHELENQNA